MTARRKGGLKKFQVRQSITIRDSKSVSCYFNEINGIKTTSLTKQEEFKLFAEYNKGCNKAKQMILNSNLRFVISVSKAFQKGSPCLELNDLIQNGNIGLMIAMKKFDTSKGFKFISYAVWWIRNEILLSVKAYADAIKLPGNSRKLQGQQEIFISDFYSKNGYKPSFHEIAEALATKTENIILLNGAIFVKSIDENVSDEDSPMLKDTLKSDSDEFDQLFSDDLTDCINKAFECLNDKEKTVLTKLYMNKEDESIGLLRLSHHMGITREGIRQIRKRALAKVREYCLTNQMEILNYI